MTPFSAMRHYLSYSSRRRTTDIAGPPRPILEAQCFRLFDCFGHRVLELRMFLPAHPNGWADCITRSYMMYCLHSCPHGRAVSTHLQVKCVDTPVGVYLPRMNGFQSGCRTLIRAHAGIGFGLNGLRRSFKPACFGVLLLFFWFTVRLLQTRFSHVLLPP
jgi:hypothetical protein